MRVTFTKVDARRYSVTIERERGPALVPSRGPGNDDLMPHDLAHFLVEEHVGIELGVWGQLAAGGGGIFWPAPEDNTARYRRTAQRISAVGRPDMARSEQLTAITVTAWERSIGRVKHQVRPFEVDVDADALRGAVERMGEFAERWRSLPYGGSLAVTWPRELTFDPTTSRRGRRPARRVPSLARRA